MIENRPVSRLVLLSLTCLACASRPSSERERERADPPQATLYGVRMEIFEGRELVAAGRAAKVTYHRSAADVIATEALLRLPSRERGVRGPGGAVSGLEVRAPSIRGNLGTRRADASDDVVLRTSTGLVGRTSRVSYDGQVGRAWGDEPARLDGPGYFMRADRFSMDFAEGLFTFEGAVDSRLGVSP